MAKFSLVRKWQRNRESDVLQLGNIAKQLELDIAEIRLRTQGMASNSLDELEDVLALVRLARRLSSLNANTFARTADMLRATEKELGKDVT